MTSTLSRDELGRDLALCSRPSIQRYSIATLRSSIQPSSRIRSYEGERSRWLWTDGVPEPKYPIVETLGGGCPCARAPARLQSHPRRAMNSRRLMFAPKLRRRHRIGSNAYFDRG